MTIRQLPGGTRGARTPPKPLLKTLMPMMEPVHRRSGDRFRGGDLLYLTTVGARTGQRRSTPVARFDDGLGGWLVVASFGGAAHHPGWYHNIVAHPDQVWAEVGGVTSRVAVEQLAGTARTRRGRTSPPGPEASSPIWTRPTGTCRCCASPLSAADAVGRQCPCGGSGASRTSGVRATGMG